MTAPLERIKVSGDSAAADTNGYAATTAGTSGQPITLTANDPGDELAHLVIITPSGSVTGNYTITGTGPEGQVQSEVLATDTTNAVTSVKYYKTVTEVLAPAGIGSETVDIGWTVASVSAWRALYRGNAIFNFGITVVSGSPTYTMQHTYDGVAVFNHATVASETTSQEGSYTGPIQAVRLSWAAAGEISLTGLQG